MLEDRRFAILAFTLLVLFWGSAFTTIKVALGYSTPVLFAGTRTLVCGVVMSLPALVWGGSVNLKRDRWIYLLLAASNVVGFMGLQTFAVMYLPSGTAAVVIYLQPILVGLLAYLLLGESLSVAKVIGLLLGFSGVVVVSAGSFSGASLVHIQSRLRVMRYSKSYETSNFRTGTFKGRAPTPPSWTALERRFRPAPISDTFGQF